MGCAPRPRPGSGTAFRTAVLCIDMRDMGMCENDVTTVLHTVQINFHRMDVNKYRYIQTPIGILLF